MPVKKPATVKKTAAKKATTKKSTTKPAASASAPEPSDELQGLVDELAGLIKSGDLDFAIADIDNAINDRLMESQRTATKKTAAKKPAAPAAKKTAATAPKRSTKKTATVKPTKGDKFTVNSIKGLQVEFQRFHKDGEDKSICKVTKGVSGHAKGKTIGLPTSALVPVA